MALLTDTLIAENPCEKISEQHFLCAGRACGTVLGGVLDPCGEGKGGVPIKFGSIAKPYFLTALSKNDIESGEFDRLVFPIDHF